MFAGCNLQPPLQIQIEFLGDQSGSGSGRCDNISPLAAPAPTPQTAAAE